MLKLPDLGAIDPFPTITIKMVDKSSRNTKLQTKFETERNSRFNEIENQNHNNSTSMTPRDPTEETANNFY